MPEVYSLAFLQAVNPMRKKAIFYNVALGIFWEAVYVIVIIGIGLLFALAIQYIR